MYFRILTHNQYYKIFVIFFIISLSDLKVIVLCQGKIKGIRRKILFFHGYFRTTVDNIHIAVQYLDI